MFLQLYQNACQLLDHTHHHQDQSFQMVMISLSCMGIYCFCSPINHNRNKFLSRIRPPNLAAPQFLNWKKKFNFIYILLCSSSLYLICCNFLNNRILTLYDQYLMGADPNQLCSKYYNTKFLFVYRTNQKECCSVYISSSRLCFASVASFFSMNSSLDLDIFISSEQCINIYGYPICMCVKVGTICNYASFFLQN